MYINPEIEDFELDRSSINDKTSEGIINNQSRNENINRLSNSRLSASMVRQENDFSRQNRRTHNSGNSVNISQRGTALEIRRK